MAKKSRSENELDALISLRKRQYEKVKNTHCPLLGEAVYFNNKGFYHALRDGRNKYRTLADASMRLNLLPYAQHIIETAKKFNRPPQLTPALDAGNVLGKEVVHYELVQSVKMKGQKREIVAVLRRIGRGRLHYYSVRYKKKQNRP